MRMNSRNRNIAYSQITLMTPSKFQNLPLLRSYDTQSRIFIVYFFQYDIGTRRLLYRNYLINFIVIPHPPWQFVQAQLTLQFFPLVSSDILIILGNNLMFNPFLEADKVHIHFTDTRVHTNILKRIFTNIFAETILTHILLPIVQVRNILLIDFM